MIFKNIKKLPIWFLISLIIHQISGYREIRVRGGTCIFLGTKCFQFVKVEKNWFEAFANCRRNFAYLVNIIDSNEMDLLSDYLLANDVGRDRFWIDGHDLASEGAFLSSKTGNHLTYVKWREGEPNNVHEAEHCVELHKGKKVTMNDNWCKEKMFSICEHDKLSPISPATNSSAEQ